MAIMTNFRYIQNNSWKLTLLHRDTISIWEKNMHWWSHTKIPHKAKIFLTHQTSNPSNSSIRVYFLRSLLLPFLERCFTRFSPDRKINGRKHCNITFYMMSSEENNGLNLTCGRCKERDSSHQTRYFVKYSFISIRPCFHAPGFIFWNEEIIIYINGFFFWDAMSRISLKHHGNIWIKFKLWAKNCGLLFGSTKRRHLCYRLRNTLLICQY